MKITRNVILDLLPLYVAGEVSSDTRALVDQYLEGDPELASQARSFSGLSEQQLPQPSLDVELTALRRTRRLLTWQRRLLAWAIAASMACLSSVFYIEQGHIRHQFLLQQYPWAMAAASSIAISCWINYFLFRRRLRVTQL